MSLAQTTWLVWHLLQKRDSYSLKSAVNLRINIGKVHSNPLVPGLSITPSPALLFRPLELEAVLEELKHRVTSPQCIRLTKPSS